MQTNLTINIGLAHILQEQRLKSCNNKNNNNNIPFDP